MSAPDPSPLPCPCESPFAPEGPSIRVVQLPGDAYPARMLVSSLGEDGGMMTGGASNALHKCAQLS
jgi:hypothetical protein